LKRVAALVAAFLATNVSAQTRPDAAPVRPAPPPAAADLRALDPENTLVVDTTKGRIVAELTPLAAPAHVARIKELARRGFYDGIVFHRVIDRFMAQTGDPTGTGQGDSDLPDLVAEFSFRRGPDVPFVAAAAPSGSEMGFVGVLPVQSQPTDMMALTADGRVTAWGLYCPGVLGMARNSEPDTANSQFFFMRQPYPSLNTRYTAFGRVVSGLDVVRALKVGEPVVDPDKMTRVRVLADIPAAERPVVRVS
jgi:peptidylprolyl isomerase